MVKVCLLALFCLCTVVTDVQMLVGGQVYSKPNSTVTISLPQVANYRREIYNNNDAYDEHIYRVCNGKNKKTCGYWENVKTKKKVPSGVTTYNKNKQALVIKKIRVSDFGKYMTGDKKTTRTVVNAPWL
ncbi:TransThyretin-Related family domain [Caenorhabditis elegans]|uniref:TransThyretin-Related family domain n=1 Tax=Caenorhabditis elegans TaxID=6239 RepID=Q21143_CAEEL|nr:TransThyretin-Related family domain [Caenorhabditis elegans]CAB01221.2 TransThyretin-Related family domain [Caenorhabditis elegans]|eukprot:NP_506525.2 Uncharacterized protein CELE_K02E11.6 [Caenorhabditis elegans]